MFSWEPTPSKWRKATSKRSSGRAERSRRGRGAGHVHSGSSRNLGGPVVSANESGVEDPVNNPWLAAVASCGCGNEDQGAVAVPPNEDASRLAKRYRWHTESYYSASRGCSLSLLSNQLHDDGLRDQRKHAELRKLEPPPRKQLSPSSCSERNGFVL